MYIAVLTLGNIVTFAVKTADDTRAEARYVLYDVSVRDRGDLLQARTEILLCRATVRGQYEVIRLKKNKQNKRKSAMRNKSHKAAEENQTHKEVHSRHVTPSITMPCIFLARQERRPDELSSVLDVRARTDADHQTRIFIHSEVHRSVGRALVVFFAAKLADLTRHGLEMVVAQGEEMALGREYIVGFIRVEGIRFVEQ